MLNSDQLVLFSSAALLLLIMPGPSVVFVTTQSIAGGVRAGLLTTLGLALGDFLQIALVSLMLAAVIAMSPVVLDYVKIFGATYLLMLAMQILSSKSEEPGKVSIAGNRAIFWQAVVVNATNPKTFLFFMSFLPTFVSTNSGSIGAQTFLLGLIFVLLGVGTNGAWAIGAGLSAYKLVTTRFGSLLQRQMPAFVFILFAVVLLKT